MKIYKFNMNLWYIPMLCYHTYFFIVLILIFILSYMSLIILVMSCIYLYMNYYWFKISTMMCHEHVFDYKKKTFLWRTNQSFLLYILCDIGENFWWSVCKGSSKRIEFYTSHDSSAGSSASCDRFYLEQNWY